MLQNLTGWHAIIILATLVLLFGAAKLPALAKSLGESVRILRTEASDTSEAVTGPDFDTSSSLNAHPSVSTTEKTVREAATHDVGGSFRTSDGSH